MGADIIGWRNCDLQQSLGRQEFLHKRKLLAYCRIAESLHQPSDPAKYRIRLNVIGRDVQEMSLSEINEQLGDFPQGIPECHACVVSHGETLGCYSYLTYPIDEVAEHAVFQFVIETAIREDAPARWLVDEVIAALAEDPMDLPRGSDPGMVLARAEPLKAIVHSGMGATAIDSTLIVDALRLSMEDGVDIAAFARFYAEFTSWLDVHRLDSTSLRELRSMAALVQRVALNCAMEPSEIWIDA
jgi:hypothetical protein